MVNPTIGRAIKRSRGELGLSTATLAQQVGIAEDDLKELEAGGRDLPANVLMRLARAMGLAATSFLSNSNADAAKPALDRAKFFHAVDAPVLSETDVVAIAREVTRSQVFADLVKPVVRLDSYELTKPGSKPWRNGYDLASTVRTALGLGSESIHNVQRLLEDKLGVLVTKHAFSDGRLRGVAVRSSKGRLVAVSTRLPTPVLRITIAHELCHHVCDLEPNDTISDSDETREEFSGSDPGVEQRAKAFAVMFLAPSSLVRELFGVPNHQFATATKALEAASVLGPRCGISTTASLWHLFHLKYLSDEEHDVQVWQRQVSREVALSDFEQTSGSSDGLLRAIDAALAGDEIETDHADWLRRL
jgi:Zn-dependent peptidase ImmA (M78 family)/transcriptional regulator with XRE-family HTH domain